MRHFVSAIAAILAISPALAQTPAFDPRAWQGKQAGEPTRVLTIGSAHLSQMDVTVTPDMLAPLVDRLAAFRPDVVTHEGLSGEQCDTIQRHASHYPGVFDAYCWPTDDAERATGLNVPAAIAEVDKVMANWPASPTAAQRRHLAALFIAAGDRPSARLQWLQISPDERRVGDGVDEALLRILTPKGGKPNETYALAVAVAARMGLQRVFAVDDHTADAVQAEAGPGLEAFMTKFWASARSAVVDEDRRRSAALTSAAGLLDYYRFINGPATQRGFIEADQLGAMQAAAPGNYGRAYFAWWEVRNLRMVANIRAAFGNRPGVRVLNIVGASHKPYYDAYLAMMSDVRLVDAEAVLK